MPTTIQLTAAVAPICRAIDIGYSTTKFILNNRGHCRLFPSLAPLATRQRAGTHALQARDTCEVHVDNLVYEVGPDTTLFREVPVLHAEYIETPQYRALLYGALSAMQLTRIDLLVTGLPVHQHSTHALRLKKLLVGTHAIRPGLTVEVRNAAIAVQPLGGLLAHLHECNSWANARRRTYLLVDPGYYTFDWLLTRGMDELQGRSGSLECGVSAYLTVLQQQLGDRLGLPLGDLHRLDDGLRNGSYLIGGREIDLQPYRAPAEAVIERAIRAMRNRIGAVDDIDEIVLVGGGSVYFLPELQRAFPQREIHVLKDAVFANVRGFQLLAKHLCKRDPIGAGGETHT